MGKKMIALLLTLLFTVGLLSAAVYFLGTNDTVMLGLMKEYAPAEATGLPEAEYPAVAAMICGYLAGKTDFFQHEYTLNGETALAFNEKEQQHMADVQKLFRFVRSNIVSDLCLAVVFSCLAGVTYGLRTLRKALRVVSLVSLGAALLVALAAAVGFEELFVLFHRVFFTNDLWLLDPATDLLIRLMPTEFFAAYAGCIGLVWLGLVAVVTFVPSVLIKERTE